MKKTNCCEHVKQTTATCKTTRRLKLHIDSHMFKRTARGQNCPILSARTGTRQVHPPPPRGGQHRYTCRSKLCSTGATIPSALSSRDASGLRRLLLYSVFPSPLRPSTVFSRPSRPSRTRPRKASSDPRQTWPRPNSSAPRANSMRSTPWPASSARTSHQGGLRPSLAGHPRESVRGVSSRPHNISACRTHRGASPLATSQPTRARRVRATHPHNTNMTMRCGGRAHAATQMVSCLWVRATGSRNNTISFMQMQAGDRLTRQHEQTYVLWTAILCRMHRLSSDLRVLAASRCCAA